MNCHHRLYFHTYHFKTLVLSQYLLCYCLQGRVYCIKFGCLVLGEIASLDCKEDAEARACHNLSQAKTKHIFFEYPYRRDTFPWSIKGNDAQNYT